MSAPLITIITPAYNVEPYIAQTIEAVLAQTEGNFEYLIVDDGSTDRTLEIAHSYEKKDSRIRVWQLEGSGNGSSVARNTAIRESKGEYISFCDGDDRWYPTFLETSLAILKAAPENVGATFTAHKYIDKLGRLWGGIHSVPLGDYDANLNLAGQCPPGNGSVLVLKKKCFDEAGLFDEDLFNCVDLDMWLRINTKSTAPLFRYIDVPLVEWRLRPGAITSNEAKRVEGLDEMFTRYGHVLEPEYIEEAYIWPATLAFYAGEDERANRWLAVVRKHDSKFFLRSKHGFVLGVFVLVGPKNGRAIRAAARSLFRAARNVAIAIRERTRK